MNIIKLQKTNKKIILEKLVILILKDFNFKKYF
jgi:hypothetical protein